MNIEDASRTDVLRQARRLMEAGRVIDAGELCERYLAVNEEDPEIRLFLATAFRNAGRPDIAYAHAKRVTDKHPDAAQGWKELTEILMELSRFRSAVETGRRYFTLAADEPESLRLYALALARAGKEKQAHDLVSGAVTRHVETVEWLKAAAEVFSEMEAHDEAAEVLNHAVTMRPDSMNLRHKLGIALRMAGRPTEAISQLEEVAQARSLAAQPHVVMGHAYGQMGLHDQQFQCYEAAFQRDPEQVDAHEAFAKQLWSLKGPSESLAHFRRAMVHAPDDARLNIIYAKFLRRAGRYLDAYERLVSAIDRLGPLPMLHDAAGLAAADAGRLEDAAEHHRAALKWRPFDVAMLENAARTALMRDAFDEARTLCSAALQANAHRQLALAYLTLALRGLGEEEEARRLADPQDFVRPLDLEPPRGWSSIEGFHTDLVRELDVLHTTEQEPVDQTLYGGTQTAEHLFHAQSPAIRALKTMLAGAVDTYVSDIKNLTGHPTNHPFVSRAHEAWRFTGAWSVRLRDEGFHVNHIHPQGWVSSAYYVSLPENVREAGAEAGETAGFITFGEPPRELHLNFEPWRTIQPKEGRLCLFPSYMWHGTVPFHGDEPRMTVAFDARPIA